MLEYQQRVISERSELAERTAKLGEFIGSPRINALGIDAQALLFKQHKVMNEYLNILGQRIAAFDIQ